MLFKWLKLNVMKMCLIKMEHLELKQINICLKKYRWMVTVIWKLGKISASSKFTWKKKKLYVEHARLYKWSLRTPLNLFVIIAELHVAVKWLQSQLSIRKYKQNYHYSNVEHAEWRLNIRKESANTSNVQDARPSTS